MLQREREKERERMESITLREMRVNSFMWVGLASLLLRFGGERELYLSSWASEAFLCTSVRVVHTKVGPMRCSIKDCIDFTLRPSLCVV